MRSWIITRSDGEMDEWLSPLGSVRFLLHPDISYSVKHK